MALHKIVCGKVWCFFLKNQGEIYFLLDQVFRQISTFLEDSVAIKFMEYVAFILKNLLIKDPISQSSYIIMSQNLLQMLKFVEKQGLPFV